jgi:cation transport ATPase
METRPTPMEVDPDPARAQARFEGAQEVRGADHPDPRRPSAPGSRSARRLAPRRRAHAAGGAADPAPRGPRLRRPRERVDLPITGMTCAACARRIETTLAKAPGVRRAGVNLATLARHGGVRPGATGMRDLMRTWWRTWATARRAPRAPTSWSTTRRARRGARSRWRSTWLSRRGVVSAGFNLGTMEVRVEYLPGATDVPTLRRAVEELGYRVRDRPRRRRGGRPRTRSRRRTRRSTRRCGASSGSPRCCRSPCW